MPGGVCPTGAPPAARRSAAQRDSQAPCDLPQDLVMPLKADESHSIKGIPEGYWVRPRRQLRRGPLLCCAALYSHVELAAQRLCAAPPAGATVIAPCQPLAPHARCLPPPAPDQLCDVESRQQDHRLYAAQVCARGGDCQCPLRSG